MRSCACPTCTLNCPRQVSHLTLARGAPGVDGVTFAAIETQGVDAFLEQIADELNRRTYVPLPARRQEIPKDGGKVRVLSIPAIRDRVVQVKVRSSSYWSRSSRRTSNRDRLDIVPRVQLMKRSTEWPEQLFRRKHVS